MHYHYPPGLVVAAVSLAKPLVGLVVLVVVLYLLIVVWLVVLYLLLVVVLLCGKQVLPGGFLFQGRSLVLAGLSVVVRSRNRVVEASLEVSVVCLLW